MSETKKYVLKRAIVGGKGKPAGSTVELTEEQANHPMYRNRVQPMFAEEAEEESGAELKVATPTLQPPKRS